MSVKMHNRARTTVHPAASTAREHHHASSSCSSSNPLEDDVYDGAALRTSLETWLSLRRSLIKTLTTILDIATNLQLFGRCS